MLLRTRVIPDQAFYCDKRDLRERLPQLSKQSIKAVDRLDRLVTFADDTQDRLS
jgi:hypothetical protein